VQLINEGKNRVLTPMDTSSNEEKITGIPTVENMFQDALLMISVYFLTPGCPDSVPGLS